MQINKLKTPNRTIRNFCFECVCKSSWDDVEECGGIELDGIMCAFHKYRMGKGRVPVKTFRKFCLHCMGYNRELVRDCTTKDCLIYPYRMGKNESYSSLSAQNFTKNKTTLLDQKINL